MTNLAIHAEGEKLHRKQLKINYKRLKTLLKLYKNNSNSTFTSSMKAAKSKYIKKMKETIENLY
jgi:hypothetical protein